MILNGKEVALGIKEELKKEVSKITPKPSLVVIQVGDDSASNIYVNSKAKLALEIGYEFCHVKFNSDVTEEEIITKIEEINENDKINGVIVQLPIPKHLNANKIINKIDPIKDIDGLTELNAGKLLTGDASLVSCTPKGIITLLKHYNIELQGKHVVIVGRSNLVGKPLIGLCLNENATVTICHSKTKNLEEITKTADILIVAIGKSRFINEKYVKEGSIIVDVGINRVDGKLYGDVDFDSVFKKSSFITPVPGGVGPMTTISLMENVLISYKEMQKKR